MNFIIYLLALCGFEHAIHISKTEINQDVSAHSLQVTMHIFIDDLEKSMQDAKLPKTYFASAKETSNAEEVLTKYLKERFKITSKDKTLEWKWVGKEVSEDYLALWCYMEISDVKPLDEITVQNDVLLDLYDDQTNIVETKLNNKTKRTSLIKSKGKKVILNF
ncbi:MAG TPA: hypothetical protein PLY70_06625 [Saprospiraceae bacterium]|nr:hypothetical protein [Saprospiraceae bacterium]HPN69353.1 hypothetical protein [Saprospiraceae bacterium]